jgi:hypothetical protein
MKLGGASEEVSFEVLSHKQGPRLKEASAHFQKERMKELMKHGTVLMNYLSEARTWDFLVT